MRARGPPIKIMLARSVAFDPGSSASLFPPFQSSSNTVALRGRAGRRIAAEKKGKAPPPAGQVTFRYAPWGDAEPTYPGEPMAVYR
jgi:hypothetical protein